jgi:hypothetical protein
VAVAPREFLAKSWPVAAAAQAAPLALVAVAVLAAERVASPLQSAEAAAVLAVREAESADCSWSDLAAAWSRPASSQRSASWHLW